MIGSPGSREEGGRSKYLVTESRHFLSTITFIPCFSLLTKNISRNPTSLNGLSYTCCTSVWEISRMERVWRWIFLKRSKGTETGLLTVMKYPTSDMRSWRQHCEAETAEIEHSAPTTSSVRVMFLSDYSIPSAEVCVYLELLRCKVVISNTGKSICTATYN